MSFSAAPIDISYQRAQPQRFRRESVAHSQGMGGISWGGMSVGSWLRDEIMFNQPQPTTVSLSPSSTANPAAYLPNLEADFCRDYACCGQTLDTLHDLLRHYEEAHIAPSPPIHAMDPTSMAARNATNMGIPGNGLGAGGAAAGGQFGNGGPNTIAGTVGYMQTGRIPNPIEAVSTNEVFMSTPIPSAPGTPMQFDEDDEMCIDDPAKHLYVMERGEHKPFKCPVNGCDKTYKNQNGLKYHKQHGHLNQKLHPNEDGTFTVIDPLSNAPYPDGMSVDSKDKPHRCEVCGKRYKNLNGLKYHRAHTTHYMSGGFGERVA